jgi:prepilin-type processing-associated H-X9-DG protein
MRDQWCYIVGGRMHGPVSVEELKALLASGELSPTTLVWPEGSDESMPAKSVPELKTAPAARPKPPDITPDVARKVAAGNALLAKQQPSAADVPRGPLPRPLSDPLRVFRRVLGILMLLQLTLPLLYVGLVWHAKGGGIAPLTDGTFWRGITDAAAFQMLVIPILIGLPLTFAFWRALPGRKVNAFYLRSFRHDRESWRLRDVAQQALGRRFRLSGIRDPRRRWPPVVRYLNSFLFALHYNTPKFMNLEAGDDWKARLWRSLGDARCVLIDLSDQTTYVAEEIQLCYHTLGLKRILFVGDTSCTAAEWRNTVGQLLWLNDDASEVRVVVWENTREGRRRFAEEVESFAAALPPGVAGLKAETLPLAYTSEVPMAPTSIWDRHSWFEVVLGLLLASVLITVYQTLYPLARAGGGVGQLLWFLPLLALGLLELFTLCRYVLECGSNRERVLTVTTFGAALLWFGLNCYSLFLNVQTIRSAADRMMSANNLKEIHFAMDKYESSTGSMPAQAIHGRDGRPLLSWRVAILPQLDEWDLYRQFKLDEPWDSPHNIQLLDRMPKVFAVPDAPPGATETPYQVPTGTGTLFPPRVKPRRDRIPDGTSQTILCAEAAQAVPWTKPEDLACDPSRPLPQFGGLFRGGFNVLFADGSIRFLPDDIKEETLRALITPSGAEVVRDDDF